MQRFRLGDLNLEVEHREPPPLGGPTLRVRRASDEHELIRFDCFARSGHWHADPDGEDRITFLPESVDALEWLLGELRDDLVGALARGGVALDPAPTPGEQTALIDRLEPALRQPPVDLDALAPERLRRSRGEKWTTYAEDVVPVWVADMDFPVAEPIRRVLQNALDRPDLGYPIHPAPTDVPEILAARLARDFDWPIDPTRVELITDVMQGIHVALAQFTREGDGVVVQTPIYPPFLGAVRETGRRLVDNPLALGPDGYRVDLDGLAREVDDGTRMLLLCNPHNPSGRVFTRDELEGIARIAEDRDLLVVSDEIHADLVYSGARHIPFASVSPAAEARTITLTSASKAFNVAGLRFAVAIFGSDALRRRFLELPRHLRGGLGILGIEAARAAWLHGGPWLDAVRRQLEANRDHLLDFVARELPGVVCHGPEATYLAWLDCRALDLDGSPYQHFLDRARVATSHGAAFGPAGRGFARINFATSRAILHEALTRIAKSL